MKYQYPNKYNQLSVCDSVDNLTAFFYHNNIRTHLQSKILARLIIYLNIVIVSVVSSQSPNNHIQITSSDSLIRLNLFLFPCFICRCFLFCICLFLFMLNPRCFLLHQLSSIQSPTFLVGVTQLCLSVNGVSLIDFVLVLPFIASEQRLYSFSSCICQFSLGHHLQLGLYQCFSLFF